ncbi:unnamed protein product [Pylaiella littoralis]
MHLGKTRLVLSTFLGAATLLCRMWREVAAADCPGDGLLGSSDERSYDFCCDSGCGECCGTGCSSRTGGGSKCCCSDIEESAYFCDGDAEPPCIVVPEGYTVVTVIAFHTHLGHLYLEDKKQSTGDTRDMKDLLVEAFNATNTVILNSGLSVVLSLVHYAEVCMRMPHLRCG